jgi:hypothetical protein
MFLFSLAKELGVPHPDFLMQILTPLQLREWIAYSNIINRRDEEPLQKSKPKTVAQSPNEAAEMFKLMAEVEARKKAKK